MSVRNSECPCKSGKKYKKCCLPKEKAQELLKEKFIKTYQARCPCGSKKRYGECCAKKVPTVKAESGLEVEV